MNAATKETRDKAYQSAREFMVNWQSWKGKLPLIVGVELYEYFGQWVQIVEMSGPYQVVIEERFGNRQVVDFEELSMKK